MVHISFNQMQIAGTFTKSITKILVFYSKAPSKTDKGMSFNVQSHDLHRRKIPRQLKTKVRDHIIRKYCWTGWVSLEIGHFCLKMTQII